METTKGKRQSVKSEKQNNVPKRKMKSAFTLFREKYPDGYAGGCDIVNMKAVLR